ncbi:MAG: hypothetical protein A2Z96_00520 [Spirochaetes bacterium GWB1_48_6]|nr:MAG: hypothetical protein A2Z96_00520 [Spirochaetes bacterium GWB1_48_6]
MSENKYVYSGNKFDDVAIVLENYRHEYFDNEIKLELKVFYELRKKNDIHPHKLIDSSEKEKKEINNFFWDNKETFFFLFKHGNLIGSILYIGNYIQSPIQI